MHPQHHNSVCQQSLLCDLIMYTCMYTYTDTYIDSRSGILLYAFARVCRLRLAPDSQYETQVIANDIRGYCAENFRHSWKALMADVDFIEYTTGTRMDDNYQYFSHLVEDKNNKE